MIRKWCDLLKSRDEELKFRHCYQEANKAVDLLVDHGCEQEEHVFMFNTSYTYLNLFLLNDAQIVS